MKAHGLASLGHDVQIISSCNGDNQVRKYMDQQVQVTRVPHLDHRLPINTDIVRWLTYSLSVEEAIAELHAYKPFDILDFPEWGAEAYVHLLNRTEWNHIPTAIQLHGPLVMFAHTMGWPDINSEFYRTGTAMEETCLRLADAVYSSSLCSIDWCVNHYGLARENVPVIYMGVDSDLFRPLDVPKEPHPTLVFVGRICAEKGTSILVEAACRLTCDYPELRLLLIGKGDSSYQEHLQSKALDFGLPNLVNFPGFIAREHLPSWLSRAHVFAAPSIYEGGPGLVYLEAMACGLPVIACKGSGAAEVVVPGENGLLIPPQDVDALETALRCLLDDPETRRVMGVGAREYAVSHADSKLHLRRLDAFYRAVISGKAK